MLRGRPDAHYKQILSRLAANEPSVCSVLRLNNLLKGHYVILEKNFNIYNVKKVIIQTP